VTNLGLLRDFVELTPQERRQVDDLNAGIEAALRPALRALWESAVGFDVVPRPRSSGDE
jgi:hypothetical protein